MAALNTIDDNQGVNRRQATRRVIRNRRPTILEFTADDFEISMEMPVSKYIYIARNSSACISNIDR